MAKLWASIAVTSTRCDLDNTSLPRSKLSVRRSFEALAAN